MSTAISTPRRGSDRLAEFPPAGDTGRPDCQHREGVEAAIAPRRIAAAAVPGALWLGFYAAWLAVRPGGEHVLTIFGDTAYLVPIAAACGLSAFAAVRASRARRLFW